MLEINGQIDSKYGLVADAIRKNFAESGEVGMSVCVFHQGDKCVDAWAGFADDKGRMPWEQDTLVNLWSSSKGLMAILIARLVDAGKLDYDAPVATYWPAFAGAGKSEVTVAQLLSHQAGLTGPRTAYPPGVSKAFVDQVLAELESQEPFWPLGTAHGYHAVSIGILVDKLVRCVCDSTMAEAWRDYVAIPFDISDDAYIGGYKAAGDQRVATLIQPEVAMPVSPDDMSPCQQAAMINIPVSADVANTSAWREIGLGSAGGTGNARGLAAAYAGLTDQVSEQTLARAVKVRTTGVDMVLGMETSFGCGFQLNEQRVDFGANPLAFGHAGWGGSFGMLDPENELAIGYAMNQMGVAERQDPRAQRLIKGVYDALGN